MEKDINLLIKQHEEKLKANSSPEELIAFIKKIEDNIDDYSSVDETCHLYYLLAHFHLHLFGKLKEDVSAWRNDKYPTHLVATINYLRKAETLVPCPTHILSNEIRMSLEKVLTHQKRDIEFLEYLQSDFTIKGDSTFALIFNKSNTLKEISLWLNDSMHRKYYEVESYFLLKKLQNNVSKATLDPIIDFIKNDKEMVSVLEKGDKNYKQYSGWQKNYKPLDYEKEEKKYRKWCLDNNLFLNPLNDITQEWIASNDTLQFPEYVSSPNKKFQEILYLITSFAAIKREYCFARFMMFEGIHKIHPHYENNHLYLIDILDGVNYDGSIEKIKTAFRICFSVFDSIAFLMKAYFIPKSTTNISFSSKANISFSSNWIKENLKDTQNNPFIDALYWLSCDLTNNDKLTSDTNKWKAPKPSLANIRKIRNAIEHSWLRVTEDEIDASDTDNLITLEILEKETLTLLKLVRSAMLYLCMAVSYEEKS